MVALWLLRQIPDKAIRDLARAELQRALPPRRADFLILGAFLAIVGQGVRVSAERRYVKWPETDSKRWTSQKGAHSR